MTQNQVEENRQSSDYRFPFIILGSLTVFGESSDFPHQMVLIYDGIHYDALYDVTAGKEVTLHSANDKRYEFNLHNDNVRNIFFSILTKALVTAKAAKEAHNYTDTTGFSLKYDLIFHVKLHSRFMIFINFSFKTRCLVCGTKLRGETEAQKHAKTTAHTNFSEV